MYSDLYVYTTNKLAIRLFNQIIFNKSNAIIKNITYVLIFCKNI